MLIIVKSGKILVDDRREKKFTRKGNNPLPFENWIFRNGQPVHDDYRRIFVAMTSTLYHHSTVQVAFASAAELFPQNCSAVHTP